jgi:integrase/recombinase XerD
VYNVDAIKRQPQPRRNETMDIWDRENLKSILAGQLAESSFLMLFRDTRAYLSYANETQQDALDSQTLLRWRNELAQNTKKSPNTINRMLSNTKRAVLEMARNKQVTRDTSLDFQDVRNVRIHSLKNRLKKNARVRIEPAKMRQLCSIPDTASFIGKRDTALLLTLASSGARASEIASLTIQQIRKAQNAYFIEISGKTDDGMRDAHLSSEAFQAINAWIEARKNWNEGIDSSYIFTPVDGKGDMNRHISASTIWRIVKKYAGLCDIGSAKPHDMRRFIGTQIAAKDIRKAQLALGHKSIEETAKHYVLDRLTGGETEGLF